MTTGQFWRPKKGNHTAHGYVRAKGATKGNCNFLMFAQAQGIQPALMSEEPLRVNNQSRDFGLISSMGEEGTSLALTITGGSNGRRSGFDRRTDAITLNREGKNGLVVRVKSANGKTYKIDL